MSIIVKDLLGTISTGTLVDENTILQILEKLLSENDTKGSFVQKINDTVKLQPSFFGVGIDFNKIIGKLLSRKKKNNAGS